MAAKKRASDDRKRGRSVPLRYRLPNAPAIFVGRDADVTWIEAAVARAPVTLVTGPGGVGKTALVLAALHGRFASAVERTLFFDVPVGQPAAQVRLDVLRALAEVRGIAEIDWASVSADPELALDRALELAESGPYFVVLDDVYQNDPDETNELLVQLATYARSSRWIATSRRAPRVPELAGQVASLSAMSSDDLQALALAWSPAADTHVVARAVAAASGSPWMLLQLLVTGARDPLEEHGLLAGLPDDAAELLSTLAYVEAPLPMSVLATFAPDPGSDALAALEQRGLIQRSAAGLRLHDVARGMLRSVDRPSADPAGQLRIAEALAMQPLAEAALEAARLFGARAAWERLRALLDRTAASLLADGFAPRLWSVLADAPHPDVAEWRLRCAAELGNPTALARVERPSLDDPAAMLAWARALRAQGDAEEALAVLERIARDDAPPRFHAEADLLASACLRQLGRYADAGRRVAAADAREDPDLALAREAARIVSHALAGDVAIENELPSVRRLVESTNAPPEALRDLAEACELLGHVPDAEAILERAQAYTAQPVLLASRELLLGEARVALVSGRLDAARRRADEVRAFARGTSLLLPVLHVVDLTRRLVAGELDGLEPLAAACAAEVQGIDARSDTELRAIRIKLAALHAAAPPEPSKGMPRANESRPERRTELLRVLGEIRRTGRPAEHTVAAGHEEEVLGRRIEAVLALARGDAATATASLAEAVRVANRYRFRSLEAEARLELCDALVCAERFTDLVAEAGALSELAFAMASARFEHESAWLTTVAREALAPGFLERAAALDAVAPVGARRARAILGDDPPLDHVDLRVLEALAASGRSASFEIVVPPPPPPSEDARARWTPGWGIDDRTRTAWLSDGRHVDLPGLSWRILETLAVRGAASKEELVTSAWDEREYHPGRHDGRLHVAVRKLREQLDDAGERAQRIVTTDTGYRLAGVVRRAR